MSSNDLTIGGCKIQVSPIIRNLGCYFDANMSLTAHVDNLRRTVLFHTKNLWRIRRYIDKNTCHHVARALIISRLDYCNSLFSQLSATNINRMQRLQNGAARVVFGVGRRTEAHPLLNSLHWLSIKKRIVFKMLLYVYKALNNLAPQYISEQLTLYIPSRTLRSASDKSRLSIPRSRSVAGERRFRIAAAREWNSLPSNIRAAPSISVFKKCLKTHLF